MKIPHISTGVRDGESEQIITLLGWEESPVFYQVDGLQLPSHQTYLGYVFIYPLYLFISEKESTCEWREPAAGEGERESQGLNPEHRPQCRAQSHNPEILT